MEESAGFLSPKAMRVESFFMDFKCKWANLTNLGYVFISKPKQHCQWGDVRRHIVRQSLGWCLLRKRQTQEAFIYSPQWGWHQRQHAVGGGKNNLALFLTITRQDIIWKFVEDFQIFALVACSGSAAGSPVTQTQNETRSKAVYNGPTPRHACRAIRRHL